MRILLIGPQGSGKSTQGKLLAEYLKIPYISTGDIFRAIAAETSAEGIRIKQILDSGQLVDDQTVINLIKERISRPDCLNGFILDGYPRTLAQAEKINLNFNKVIYLKISQELVLNRLLKRGRADDTEDLINKRLDLYYQQTESLLDYYKNKSALLEIDATRDIPTIQDEIKKSL